MRLIAQNIPQFYRPVSVKEERPKRAVWRCMSDRCAWHALPAVSEEPRWAFQDVGIAELR
jgi:hypothetical protein